MQRVKPEQESYDIKQYKLQNDYEDYTLTIQEEIETQQLKNLTSHIETGRWSIRIMNTKMDNSYSARLIFDVLIKQDVLFGAYENLHELMEDLEEAIESGDQDKFILTQVSGGLDIKLKVEVNSDIKYLRFNLKQENVNNEDQNRFLMNKNKEMKETLIDLKEKIKKTKLTIKLLTEKQKYQEWQFTSKEGEGKVKFESENQSQKITKIGDDSWFRVFGNFDFVSGIYKWTITLLEWKGENIKNISFGLCQKNLHNQMQSKKSFAIKDIIGPGYYGLMGSGDLNNMKNKKGEQEKTEIKLKQGDKLYFKMDFERGKFEIFLNSQLVAYTDGLKNKILRPCYDMFYGNSKTVAVLKGNFFEKRKKQEIVQDQFKFWTFGEQMKGNKIDIFQGMHLQKATGNSWFRTFGSGLFTSGIHSWDLQITKYSNSDKTGIAFGLCENRLFKEQSEKDSFQYNDIRANGFYGIGGASYTYQMEKQQEFSLSTGDIFNLHLDFEKGFFQISKDKKVLAKTSNIFGKKLRPSLSIYYANQQTIIDLIQRNFWKFGYNMQGSQVDIQNNGMKIVKKGVNSWFRVFGEKVFQCVNKPKDDNKNIYEWVLHIEKYAKGDKSGITFGVCEEELAQKQIAQQSFNYTKDINHNQFYGVGGSRIKYNMEIKQLYFLQKGDKFIFNLDMNKGEFTISKNDQTIAKCEGLSAKRLRPSLSIYYTNDTIVNFSPFYAKEVKEADGEDQATFIQKFGYKTKGDQITLEKNKTIVNKVRDSAWFRTFGEYKLKLATFKWSLVIKDYQQSDKSGITFGICEEEKVKEQINKTAFSYKDINTQKFYGIGGSQNIYNMKKEVSYTLKQNDKFDFCLSCGKGEFTISKDNQVLAKTKQAFQKISIRPSLSIYYPKTSIRLTDCSVDCPGEHGLIEFTTPMQGLTFNCDLCGKKVAKGIIMFGCRSCDFDICKEHYKLPEKKMEDGIGQWKFGYEKKGNEFTIEGGDGRTVSKINSNKWFRVWGDYLFKNATYEWTLEIIKYDNKDKGGITFGICENQLVDNQIDKMQFNYDNDIKVKQYYGISGSQVMYNMDKKKIYTMKTGDKFDFYLSLKQGVFKIKKDGYVLAEKRNLQRKLMRPSLDFCYADQTTVKLSDCIVTCPGEHGLKKFEAYNNAFGCDLCVVPKRIKIGAVMFGCRVCNFDTCEDH